ACMAGDRAQGCARSAVSSTDVLSADRAHWEKKGVFFGYFLCTSKESDPRSSIAEALALKHQHQKQSHWIPAFAGMTSEKKKSWILLSRERQAESRGATLTPT